VLQEELLITAALRFLSQPKIVKFRSLLEKVIGDYPFCIVTRN